MWCSQLDSGIELTGCADLTGERLKIHSTARADLHCARKTLPPPLLFSFRGKETYELLGYACDARPE